LLRDVHPVGEGEGCGLGTHKTDFTTFIAPYVPPTARMAAALIWTVDATDAVQEALVRVWWA